MTCLWTLLLAAAVLWPGRVLGPLDGIPLNGRIEAIVIGLLLPTLWCFDRRFLAKPWARAAILALLAAKLAALPLAQQGLCARFSTSAPLIGVIQTIPVNEPRGFLRSWDARADWRAAEPTCTAIVDRPYRTQGDFPAWFVNVLDFVRPGRRDLSLDLSGYVRVASEGTFSLRTGEDMTGTGVDVRLEPGVQFVSLHANFTGDRWALLPKWNGTDAWPAFTTTPPRGIDAAGGFISWLISGLVLAIATGWLAFALLALRPTPVMIAWTVIAGGVSMFFGLHPQYERLAGPALLAAACVPLSTRQRGLRSALLLIGIPWLAFFAARSVSQIGTFSSYSADDWLTYQVAGYRIFMGGYWLEGGSNAFDYQPLYRWITGALHLVFGDSSVGEVYWDAACVLSGSLLAYALAKRAAGYRGALIAAGATLAVFTIGTPWYFFGRGLSEISAAGFAFLAAFFLLRARLGRLSSAGTAGMFAVLMFYTRLNHLVFAVFLLALLLPLGTSASFADLRRSAGAVRASSAFVYVAIFTAGVVLFMTRTWWYTSAFSLFYGTSLKNNDTGLRLTTLASMEVWRNVAHSLSALIWMNDPPRPDLRAAGVVSGVIAAALAVMRVPPFKKIPASIAIVSLGAAVSALFVHTHNYPGRMSVHLVPFSAAAMMAAVRSVMDSARGPFVTPGIERR